MTSEPLSRFDSITKLFPRRARVFLALVFALTGSEALLETGVIAGTRLSQQAETRTEQFSPNLDTPQGRIDALKALQAYPEKIAEFVTAVSEGKYQSVKPGNSQFSLKIDLQTSTTETQSSVKQPVSVEFDVFGYGGESSIFVKTTYTDGSKTNGAFEPQQLAAAVGLLTRELSSPIRISTLEISKIDRNRNISRSIVSHILTAGHLSVEKITNGKFSPADITNGAFAREDWQASTEHITPDEFKSYFARNLSAAKQVETLRGKHNSILPETESNSFQDATFDMILVTFGVEDKKSNHDLVSIYLVKITSPDINGGKPVYIMSSGRMYDLGTNQAQVAFEQAQFYLAHSE